MDAVSESERSFRKQTSTAVTPGSGVKLQNSFINRDIGCVGNTAGFLQDSGINISVQSFRVRRKFST